MTSQAQPSTQTKSEPSKLELLEARVSELENSLAILAELVPVPHKVKMAAQREKNIAAKKAAASGLN